MPATVPTLKVEIAFATTNAFDTSPTWTDVSSYVLVNPGVSIQRGRANELTTFSAGKCTLTLRNDDGRFSPLNASSPYAGQLLPRKQIRVSATWAATDYEMFRGFVTGWPQSYSKAKKQAFVPLECYDLFAILNETTLTDMYYGYMKTGIGSLVASWRRLVNRALVDKVGGGTAPTFSSNVAGASDLASGLSDSDAVVFDNSFYAAVTDSVDITGTAVSYSFWLKTSTVSQTIIGKFSTSAGSTGSISIASDGTISGSINTGSTSSVTSSAIVNDNQVHHVVLVFNGATSNVVYIDGVDKTATQSAAAVTHRVDIIGGYLAGLAGASSKTYFTGTLQDVATFSKALSATEARTLYRIGMGNVLEDTATRFGRVCDSAGVVAGLRNTAGIATPYGACAETWDTGSSALAQLQVVAATEQGALFVGRTGLVTLLHRYWHQDTFQGGVVQIIFSDDGSDSQYVDIGFDYDDLNVQNQVTVSSGAGSAFYLSQTSIDRYGLQDTSVTTQLGSYPELRTMAEGLTYWRKDPTLRTRPITEYPQRKTSTWATVLGLDIGHRIGVEITPPGVGAQYTNNVLIQQLDWDISSTDWAFTFQGSPIPASFGLLDSLVLDTDILGF
jgi:hypothetical protein